MGRNPEAGDQPFNNRVEGAKSTIKALRVSAQKALNDLLAPPTSKLATGTASPPLTGKPEAPLDPKQTLIQKTQTQDRGAGTKTPAKPTETSLTQKQLEQLEKARLRRLQEELEVEGGPTQADTVSANAGKLKSPLVRFIQRNPALAATVGISSAAIGVGLVAVGVNEMLSNRTEAHQAIPSSPEAPSTFDNTVKEGTVGENTMERLSQNEIAQQFPTPFDKAELVNPTIVKLPQPIPPGGEANAYPDIPIIISENKSTVQLLFPLDISKSSNPNAVISYSKSFGGSSKAERDFFQGKDIYDTITFYNVPGGTQILAPVGGFLTLATDTTQQVPPNGADNQGALIDFISPDGILFRLRIGGGTTKDFDDGQLSEKTGFIFVASVDAPVYKPENSIKDLGSYGIPAVTGHQIFVLINPQNGVPIERVTLKLTAMTPTGEYVPADIGLFATPQNRLVARE